MFYNGDVSFKAFKQKNISISYIVITVLFPWDKNYREYKSQYPPQMWD